MPPLTSSHSSSASAQAAASAYIQAAAEDPLTAPHAEVAFEVLSKLGEGGMGTVYEVRDKRTGRLAALKRLPRERADALNQRRFLREAALTAKLDHPCIPPVHEVGRSPRGELYLLMRAIRGRTLEAELKALRGAPLSERRPLLEALIKVAEALAYAHSQGVVHRDVKPANIMIGEYGEVLLLDWGVARDLRAGEADIAPSAELNPSELAAAGLTVSGTIVGTPGYMAPEQARGEAVDERADVYALGLLLGELLTDAPLVGGESSMVRHFANSEGTTRLPEVGGEIPGPLRWVLAEALAADPDERTESAGVFADDLRACLADELPAGYAPGLGERLVRGVRRHPSWLLGSLAAVALTALVVSLRLALEQAEQRRVELAAAEGERAQAQDEAQRAQRVLEEFNRARELARRGLKADLRAPLEAALKLADRSEDALLTAAEIASLAEDAALARELLEECARRFSPAYVALFRLHEQQSRGDDFVKTEAMRELLKRAEARGEESEYSLLFRGLEAHQRGEAAEAASLFARAAALNRTLFTAVLGLAVSKGQLGERDVALRAFEEAEALRPDNARVYLCRADYLRLIGERRLALKDLDRALEIDRKQLVAWRLRGAVRLELGELEGAARDFSQALVIDSKSAVDYINRARVRLRQEAFKAALDDCDLALEIDSELAMAWFNRGQASRGLGDLAGARRDLDRAHACEPGSALILASRANLRAASGDTEGGLRDYNRAIDLDPKFIAALVNRAILRSNSGDMDGALADYEAILAIDEDFAIAYNNRGHISKRRGDAESALRDFNRAIALDSKLLVALINRAELLATLGELDGARADFDRVLAIQPRNFGILVQRAKLLLRLNESQAALVDLELALEVQPEDPEVRALLARLRQAAGSR